jgi:hypothetical protein
LKVPAKTVKCGVGKCNNFCWLVVVIDGEGNLALGRGGIVDLGEVNDLQVGVKVTSAGKDGADGVIDCYCRVGEGCRASSIAELANGDQGDVSECWEQVGNAGCWW